MVVARLQQAVIADRDPVRVAGRVLEHGLGATGRWLGVDHPIERTRTSENAANGPRVAQRGQPPWRFGQRPLRHEL